MVTILSAARPGIPVKLDDRVRDRIVAETRGNPLALLELPRGLTATELAVGFGLPGEEWLSARIEESFSRRLGDLSDEARRLLLIAAAEPLGDLLVLHRACARLGIPISKMDIEADTGGFLSLDVRVTFRHPLMRSAVYRSASSPERRAAHLALADATEAETDPDRRAWHLAVAAEGPDEDVAAQLERSADRAQARGGLAATAAFLRLAVALTESPVRRADRALAAAHANLQAGNFDAALALLMRAESGPIDGFQRARIDLLRGQAGVAAGRGSDGPALMLRAARRLEPLDIKLARETYLAAWGAAFMTAGPFGGSDVLVELCRSIRALPPPEAPGLLDLLLDGIARLVLGEGASAVATLRRAAAVLSSLPDAEALEWGWPATAASTGAWDFEAFEAGVARLVELARNAGALAHLPHYLNQLAYARAWTGDFAGAGSLIAESDGVAEATRRPFAPYALLRLRGLQGNEDAATAAIATAMTQATSGGQGLAAAWAHWTGAVLNNGLGRYPAAVAEAKEAALRSINPWVSMWALPELVEAAVRTGELQLARGALERLAKTTQPSATDWALGIEARAGALLSAGQAAERLSREAIERLERTPLRPELARAHLLYGEWLRRENRRVDARAQLRTAYEQFVSIGMEAFAERARAELLATGERVRKRTAGTRDDLTAQERQVARLARDGLSNVEIGTRLFLSPRTVEWHLSKVFTKLGVRSRRELLRLTELPAD